MIKQQRKIKFINDWDAIVDTIELEKAIFRKGGENMMFVIGLVLGFIIGVLIKTS